MLSRGNSLLTWTLTLSVVLATLFFIQPIVKTTLQGKVMHTADYFFWTKWDQSIDQYKGATNTFVKSVANKQENKTQKERDAHLDEAQSYTQDERSVSSAVQDGSQVVLKTFDLNEIVH